MKIDFDVTAAIRSRHSVRTYDPDLAPDEATCRKIMAFDSDVGNPFGVEGVSISLIRGDRLSDLKLGTYGVIRGASAFLGLTVPDNDEALIAGAYQMEAAILYATSLGLGTVWLGGTLRRQAFAKAFGLADGLILPAISPIGYPAPRRLLERVMRSAARSDSRKPWEKMFFSCCAGVPLTQSDAGPFAEALGNTRLAPSSLNAQPWRLIKDGERFHFYAQYSDSLSAFDRKLKHIDMGIALCHFSLTLDQAGIYGDFCKCDALPPTPAGYHYITSWRLGSRGRDNSPA